MNGGNKKVAWKVAIALVAVTVLGAGVLGTPIYIPPSNSQVAITPSGSCTLAVGGFLAATISGIDKTAYTTVKIYEQTPDGVQHTFDLSWLHASGSVQIALGGNSAGTHTLFAWVDNNANGIMEFGELASIQISVVGNTASAGICCYLGTLANLWMPNPPTSAGPKPPRP